MKYALILALALGAVGPAEAWEPRNPQVDRKTYNDCQRLPEYCAGRDSERPRRDYYRNKRRQGSGEGVYRGEKRVWDFDEQ